MRTNTKSSPLSIRLKVISGATVQVVLLNSATGTIYTHIIDLSKPIYQEDIFDSLEEKKDKSNEITQPQEQEEIEVIVNDEDKEETQDDDQNSVGE